MCIINVKKSIMHAARHGERSTPSISELRFVVATCQFPNDWDALEVKLLLYLLSSSLYPNSIMIISRARRRNWASKYLNLGYSYTKTIIFSTAFFGCYKLENFCSSCFRRFFLFWFLIPVAPGIHFVCSPYPLTHKLSLPARMLCMNLTRKKIIVCKATFIIYLTQTFFRVYFFFVAFSSCGFFADGFFLSVFGVLCAGFVDWTHIKSFTITRRSSEKNGFVQI